MIEELRFLGMTLLMESRPGVFPDSHDRFESQTISVSLKISQKVGEDFTKLYATVCEYFAWLEIIDKLICWFRGDMLEVGVVDLSADSRRRLGALLERWAWLSPESHGLHLPRLSLRLLSPEEIRFHGGLDLCVVGAEVVSCDITQVAAIRRQLPDTPLLCILDAKTYSFGMVEQLGRVQVDDVLTDTASSDEFFRRIILLARRSGARSKGSLTVVDSARGGVGVTLVAAALSEVLADSGKKACLVDTDVFSQDAARFLQCRPFVNEPLKLILDNQRVPTPQTVRECAFKVWEDHDNLFCVTPPAACDQLVFGSVSGIRALTGVLECLQLNHSHVVVDASSLPTSARQVLYQVADAIVFVVNRDPSGAYANRQALSLVHGYARRDARLAVVVNDTTRSGLSVSVLEEEIFPSRDRVVEVFELPFSPRAARWPCSGGTAAQFLRKNFVRLGSFLCPSSLVSDGKRVGSTTSIRAFIARVMKYCRARWQPVYQQRNTGAVATEGWPVLTVSPTASQPSVIEDELVGPPVLRKASESSLGCETHPVFLKSASNNPCRSAMEETGG